eukprot:TRINITY_DN46003_c0_g1_i1.p1 TRINITY_DN46003_c0_g1~~TRINITY_DN46003_c0_g1_i1.p1  ORF type:complete len:845 (+),score=210.33 TRINITY_DN46003_c0_g1_i1:116-2650(+)
MVNYPRPGSGSASPSSHGGSSGGERRRRPKQTAAVDLEDPLLEDELPHAVSAPAFTRVSTKQFFGEDRHREVQPWPCEGTPLEGGLHELPYEWMFAFPTPHLAKSKERQARFESACRTCGFKSVDEAMSRTFSFWEFGPLPSTRKLVPDADGSSIDGSLFHRAVERTRYLFRCFFSHVGKLLDQELVARADRGELNVSKVRAQVGAEHMKWTRFMPPGTNHVYVCVRMDKASAEVLADLMDFSVQLSRRGVRQLNIKLSDPNTVPAHAKFTLARRHFFRKFVDPFDDTDTVLREVDRIRILYDRLVDAMDVVQLRALGVLDDHFPLHERRALTSLRRHWADMRNFFVLRQPLHQVKDYFGEEIAFYYVFNGELCIAVRLLAVLALLSLGRVGLQIGTGAQETCLASGIIIVWFRVVTLRWLRTENELTEAWGIEEQRGSTVKPLVNFRLRGKLLPSPLNENRVEMQVSRRRARLGQFAAFALMALFVLIMAMVNTGQVLIFWQLWQMYRDDITVRRLLSAGIGCATGTIIKLGDVIFARLGDWITDFECWHLEADFNWWKSAKIATVRFINTIGVVVFFGFVFARLECGENPTDVCFEKCRVLFQLKVVALFVTRFIILGPIEKVLKPRRELLKRANMGSKAFDVAPFSEYQIYMMRYTPSDLCRDYLDVTVPLAFVVLFGSLVPSLALLLLLALQLQLRCSAWKLTHLFRRPYPRLADGIGVSRVVLELLGVLMPLSHVGLILINYGGVENMIKQLGIKVPGMSDVPGLSTTPRWFLDWTFYMLHSFVIVGAYTAVGQIVPAVSSWVVLERFRHNLQRRALLHSDETSALRRSVQTSTRRRWG